MASGRAFDEARERALRLLQCGVGFERRLLRVLALGDVGPGADELAWPAFIVRPVVRKGLCVAIDDFEGILNPDVVSVPVAKAVLDHSAAAVDERRDLVQNARRIIGMETVAPVLEIGNRLLGLIAHDRLDVLADEGAREIAGCARAVDDGGTDGEEMLETKPGPCQLAVRFLASGLRRLEVLDALAKGNDLVHELFIGLEIAVHENVSR